MALPAQDNFNRSTGIGANWTGSLGADLAIESNIRVYGASVGADASMYWSADAPTADQYAQVKLLTAVDWSGPFVHGSATDWVMFDVKDLQALFCDTSPDAALLVNTGLLLIDLRCPAIEHVHFEINDAIFKTDTGEFYTDVEPEDWYFSRQLAEQGARVMVTRRVGLRHMGRAPFPNRGLWGSWETDQAAKSAADAIKSVESEVQ